MTPPPLPARVDALRDRARNFLVRWSMYTVEYELADPLVLLEEMLAVELEDMIDSTADGMCAARAEWMRRERRA